MENWGQRPLFVYLQATFHKSLLETSPGECFNLVKLQFPLLPSGDNYSKEKGDDLRKPHGKELWKL